jgi:hypothetical protein
MKSKEEILNSYLGTGSVHYKSMLRIMEEYASQFTAPASPLPISDDEEKKYSLKEVWDMTIETLKLYVPKDEYVKVYDAHILFCKQVLELEKTVKARDGEVEKLVDALRQVHSIANSMYDTKQSNQIYKISLEALKPYQSPVTEIK